MPNTDAVKAYIAQLPNSEGFEEMDPAIQDKQIFKARESLKGHFLPAVNPNLSERAIALQVLHQIDGDAKEYSKLKEHGVQSYSVKDVSVSFQEGVQASLSIEAVEIIERLNPSLVRRGRVGRLL